MKKKLFSLLSLAAVLGTTISVTACGVTSSSSESTSTSEVTSSSVEVSSETSLPLTFDKNEPVEIKFYSTMGQNLVKAFDIFLEDFYEEYPNITVSHEQIGGYDDVLSQNKTELAIGEGPDITYCYADHVALYNKTGRVVKLDSLIDDPTYGLTQEQKDDFIPGYYGEGRQFGDDNMYTLPLSKSTEVLYYNKTFFEKNNLTVPTTWDEMEEVCAKIKALDPNSIPLGYDSASNWFITMTEQLKSPYTSADPSTGYFLFNNDTNKEFVKEFRTWYEKGYVTTQDLYGSYTSGLFTETAAENQKCYMCIGSSAGASHQIPNKLEDGTYPFETGIVSIPQVDAANNARVISQGPSLCLFDQKDPQKLMASWLLMRFLTTNASFQAQFAITSGYVPVIKSVNEIPAYKEHIKKTGNDYITSVSANLCLQQEEYYFTSPAFLGSSKARIEVGNLLNKAFTEKGDADTIINTAFNDAIYNCQYEIGLV